METVTKDMLQSLYQQALKASEKAYAPYSQFPVGAALLCEDGTVITGVNVENRSFGLTNCAERTALYSAVTQGYHTLCAIAIATPTSKYPVSPCGACRQVLSEFASADTPIVFGHTLEQAVYTVLEQLFPFDALHELKKDNK